MRNKWMMSLCCGAAMLACVPSAAQQNVQPEPMQTGKYQPAWESLAAYECPDWFRDAKSAFGRIGGRSANRSRAIGMRVTCTIRVIGSMTCT